MIAVLAMAGGMLVDEDLVKAMSKVANTGAELRELREREAVQRRRDRYGLPVYYLGPPQRLISPSLDKGLALRDLVTHLEHFSSQPKDLLSVSDAALKLLEFACEAGEWETVIGLARAVEPALILSGRWEAWRYTLEQGLHAAKTLHKVADQAHFLHQIGGNALVSDDPGARFARSTKRSSYASSAILGQPRRPAATSSRSAGTSPPSTAPPSRGESGQSGSAWSAPESARSRFSARPLMRSSASSGSPSHPC